MLNNSLPYKLFGARNPIFDYALRRMQWPRSGDDLPRYARDVIVGALVSVGVIWMIAFGAYRGYGEWPIGSAILLIIGFATVVSTVATDFFCILVMVGMINQQIMAGHLDLLRLTGRDERSIFEATLAVAQIRVWRLMSVETAIRAIGAEFVVLTLVFSLIRQSRGFAGPSLLSCVVILAAIYVIEPRWKMPAVVGLSMAIAAQVHNLAFAVLGALGAVFMIRLLQGIALGLLWYAVLALAFNVDEALVFVALPLMCAGIALLFWRFYRVLDNRVHRRAFHLIFRAEFPAL